MGRKSKLTPQAQNDIVSAIKAGNYQETAALYAGIDAGTYYRWMERGRIEQERLTAGAEPDEAETPYREFREVIEKARASAEIGHVANITRAASDGTWQASAWFLERSHPQKWGRINRTEISGPSGGPIETVVDIDRIDEKLSALFERLDPDK